MDDGRHPALAAPLCRRLTFDFDFPPLHMCVPPRRIEEGFWRSCGRMGRSFAALSPMFFLFGIQTKVRGNERRQCVRQAPMRTP